LGEFDEPIPALGNATSSFFSFARKNRSTAGGKPRRRLLDALLAEALAPAEDREMEAAE
jgi:hypothetical protein